MADPKLSPPAINLARANLCPTSDVRDYRARRQALRNNRSFLSSAPTPPPFWACYDLNPRHRTVPNTSANTISCTSAYQPNPPKLGEAAITAGLLLSQYDRFVSTFSIAPRGAHFSGEVRSRCLPARIRLPRSPHPPGRRRSRAGFTRSKHNGVSVKSEPGPPITLGGAAAAHARLVV